jgi:hypothetical protein
MQESPVNWAFLACLPICGKALAFVIGLEYFALIFNGSDLLAVTGRDKDATGLVPGAFCDEHGWPLRRLLFELRQGTVRCRTYPAASIDWWAPNIEAHLDALARGEVTVYWKDPKSGAWVGREETVAVEILPLQAAALPSSSADAPADAPVPPRKVSDADLRRAVLAMVAEFPPGHRPPAEESAQEEVERRLGASVERDRFRQALKDHAPHFKLRRGRPRKRSAQF